MTNKNFLTCEVSDKVDEYPMIIYEFFTAFCPDFTVLTLNQITSTSVSIA